MRDVKEQSNEKLGKEYGVNRLTVSVQHRYS